MPLNGFGQELRIGHAGINGLGGRVGGAALPSGDIGQPRLVTPMADRHRCQPHEAAIACGVWFGTAGIGVAVALPAQQCLTGCGTDVEAVAGAGVGATLVPADKALHEIGWI